MIRSRRKTMATKTTIAMNQISRAYSTSPCPACRASGSPSGLAYSPIQASTNCSIRALLTGDEKGRRLPAVPSRVALSRLREGVADLGEEGGDLALEEDH